MIIIKMGREQRQAQLASVSSYGDYYYQKLLKLPSSVFILSIKDKII